MTHKVRAILAKRHNLNKVGRGPIDYATYQISRPWPCGFKQDFFHVFLLLAYVKRDPLGGILAKRHT